MKQFIRHLFLIIALVGVYYLSDFIDKGITLNKLFPIPIFGVIFWVFVLYVFYTVIMQPLIMFCRLTAYKKIDITKQAKLIESKIKKTDMDLYNRLHNKLLNQLPKNSPDWTKREEELSVLIDEYYVEITPATKDIIRKYSWKAALCVVFSRNNFIDGILMFMSQVKMATELMKLYGFKLSPLFNFLCFFWIASNSALTGIFNQAGADSVGEVLGDMLLNGGLIEEGLQNKMVSKASSCVVEALTSATTVYTTGMIINRKLKGETRNIEVKELFQIRKEGRIELLKELPANALKEVEKYFS